LSVHNQEARLARKVVTIALLSALTIVSAAAEPKPKPSAQPKSLNLLSKPLPPLKTIDPANPPGAARPDQTGSYTLQSSVQTGLQRNPAIKVADERVATAVARYEQNASVKNPKFVFQDTTTIRTSGASTINTSPLLTQRIPSFPQQIRIVDTVHSQITLGLQLLLTTFGRVEKQIAAAFLNIDAQAAACEIDRRNLSYDVKRSFLEHLRALAKAEATRANLEVSDQNLSDTQALFRQGVMAKYDVVQAELQVTTDTQRLAQTLNEIDTTRATFRSLIVAPPDSPVLLVPPAPIQIDAGVDLKALQDVALEKRPEIVSLRRQMDVADALLEAAENESNPEVGMNLHYLTNPGISLGIQDLVMLSFNFSWALYDGGLGAAKVAEAESQIRSLKEQGEQLRLAVLLDVETSWLRYQQTFYDLQTAEKRVETAMVYYDMARQRFVNGLGTSLETQEALRSLNNARVGLVLALYDRDLAFAALEQSLGTDFFDRHLNLAKEAGK